MAALISKLKPLLLWPPNNIISSNLSISSKFSAKVGRLRDLSFSKGVREGEMFKAEKPWPYD